MVKRDCDLEGWEGVSVSYPAEDELTMRHVSRFESGASRAYQPYRDSLADGKDGDESLIPSAQEAALLGAAQLCEVEGLEVNLKTITLPELWKLPAGYAGLFAWIVAEVGGAYQRAKQPPKNS